MTGIWKRNFVRLRKKMKDMLIKISRCNISMYDFYTYSVKNNEPIFSDKPFQKKGSFKFFKLIKHGTFQQIEEMILKNKYYVLETDYVNILFYNN